MTQAVEPHTRPTYADIEALPSHVVGEILGGELIVSPRPAMPHAETANQLSSSLTPPFSRAVGGPGGWRIYVEPELSLAVDPDFDPVVPDLAGWRVEALPERPLAARMTLTPQWVCEILSSSTRRTDRMLKVPFYARAGVRWVWLIDPIDETLEVLVLHEERYVIEATHFGDDVVRAVPFDAVPLALSWLWGRKPPEPEGAVEPA
jgi:hypothetical protein